ncbi:hypothetical protein FHX59_004956 [Paraburkholderia silvatlantica]|uniref:Uncharacterized protein n=1 Tax=Paraburkholderia silvatlantica TaxID=321895 RepID=A0ABR6FTY2_9BURK|nr:hypothetical protein [Paraburkholderia silvatlantica]
MAESLGDEKAISRYAQRRVVMKAAPTATLEMSQTKLLLEILIIALDTPAQFCKPYQFLDWGVGRHVLRKYLVGSTS